MTNYYCQYCVNSGSRADPWLVVSSICINVLFPRRQLLNNLILNDKDDMFTSVFSILGCLVPLTSGRFTRLSRNLVLFLEIFIVLWLLNFLNFREESSLPHPIFKHHALFSKPRRWISVLALSKKLFHYNQPF